MKAVASVWIEKLLCKSNLIAIVLFSLTADLSDAQENAIKERYTVQGNVLFFDMAIPFEDDPSMTELELRDVGHLALMVMEHPNVSEIALTGPGGSGPAAKSISSILIKFKMDTRVVGRCVSACAEIFLAGRTRSLSGGSSLGFHRPYIESAVERAYFERYRDERGWVDEFDYVVWIYDVAQSDMLETSRFMAARGVSQNFIFEAFSYSGPDMWYPSTQELIENGVVTQILD
jgi:hypothetical protein